MHYRGFTFYKMTNLDNRIANPDQLLTQDVEKFCDTLGDLYSNICKVGHCSYVFRYWLVGMVRFDWSIPGSLFYFVACSCLAARVYVVLFTNL